MTHTEALRLALDTLLIVRNNSSVSMHQLALIGPAIEACRAALAAPSVPSGEPPKLIDMGTINAAWEKRDPGFQRCFYSFVAGVAFAEKHCAAPAAPGGAHD
jgi:hypothetical protein